MGAVFGGKYGCWRSLGAFWSLRPLVAAQYIVRRHVPDRSGGSTLSEVIGKRLHLFYTAWMGYHLQPHDPSLPQARNQRRRGSMDRRYGSRDTPSQTADRDMPNVFAIPARLATSRGRTEAERTHSRLMGTIPATLTSTSTWCLRQIPNVPMILRARSLQAAHSPSCGMPGCASATMGISKGVHVRKWRLPARRRSSEPFPHGESSRRSRCGSRASCAARPPAR